MLKKFIRTEDAFFNPETGDCEGIGVVHCDLYEQYVLPFKKGDTIKWIQEIGTLLENYEIGDLRLGIVKDCLIAFENIGTFEIIDGQLYCIANIPSGVQIDSCYQFIIYTNFNPVDCDEFSGLSFDDVEALETLIGDINCTFDELE